MDVQAPRSDQGKETAVRKAGPMQAAILLVTGCFVGMIVALLGPTLPAMQRYFADTPGVDYLVPVSSAAPMLAIAVTAVFAGILSDRVGRKRLLVVACLLYALAGTAPLYLDSIYQIIASRFALGLLDAILVTVSTTLIGDYYQGEKRARLIALQTVVGAASAFICGTLGGVIGELGWRAPYALYAIGIPLAPLMMIYLWEPVRMAARRTPSRPAGDAAPPPLDRAIIATIAAIAILGGVIFLVIPVNTGYVCEAIGVTSTPQIGAAVGMSCLGLIAGGLAFGWLIGPRLNLSQQFALAFAVTGAGFLMVDIARSFPVLLAAAVVSGCGAGLLLPIMSAWAMRVLPEARRGTGIGILQSCLSLGMFVSPLVTVSLSHIAGGVGPAIGVMGLTLAVMAPLTLAVIRATPRHA
jgi:MFS family permease